MTNGNDDRTPEDLQDVAELLRSERPRLSALQLDDVQMRVVKRLRAPRKDSPMKSRLAITLMLVFGLLTSMGGVGLAVEGISSSGSAAGAEYCVPGDKSSGQPGTDGDEACNDVKGDESSGNGDVLGAQDPGNPNDGDDGTNIVPAADTPDTVQAPEQVATGGELPFTGYLSIPVLLIGLGVLTAGLVMRRRLGDVS